MERKMPEFSEKCNRQSGGWSRIFRKLWSKVIFYSKMYEFWQKLTSKSVQLNCRKIKKCVLTQTAFLQL